MCYITNMFKTKERMMREYLKQYVECVVEPSDMSEALPTDSDVVLLTRSELYHIIQNARAEGYHEDI